MPITLNRHTSSSGGTTLPEGQKAPRKPLKYKGRISPKCGVQSPFQKSESDTVVQVRRDRWIRGRRKQAQDAAVKWFEDAVADYRIDLSQKRRLHEEIRKAYRPLQKAKMIWRQLAKVQKVGKVTVASLDLSAAMEARAALWRKHGRDVYPLPQERHLGKLERDLLAGQITQDAFNRACNFLAGQK